MRRLLCTAAVTTMAAWYKLGRLGPSLMLGDLPRQQRLAEARLHPPADQDEQQREEPPQCQCRPQHLREPRPALHDPSERDLVPAQREEPSKIAHAARHELVGVE